MHPCDPYDHTCVRPNWKNQYLLRRITLWKIIYSLFLPKESRRKEMNATQEWIRPIVVPYAYEYSSAPITLRSTLDVYNQKCFVSLKNRNQKRKKLSHSVVVVQYYRVCSAREQYCSMLAACFGQVSFRMTLTVSQRRSNQQLHMQLRSIEWIFRCVATNCIHCKTCK